MLAWMASRYAPLALHRSPADVVAAKTLGPIDAGDRRVGARLRLRDCAAGRRHIEHPAAAGEEPPVLFVGAGVKDDHVVECFGPLHALDLGAFLDRARVS